MPIEATYRFRIASLSRAMNDVAAAEATLFELEAEARVRVASWHRAATDARYLVELSRLVCEACRRRLRRPHPSRGASPTQLETQSARQSFT